MILFLTLVIMSKSQENIQQNIIAFFSSLYYNYCCKKNLPFKNFFYITPYLIIYTPLEIKSQENIQQNIIAFFSSLYYNYCCKKNLPFKNFFYITPYLIIYTPLEIPGSSPTGYFSLYILSDKKTPHKIVFSHSDFVRRLIISLFPHHIFLFLHLEQEYQAHIPVSHKYGM